MTTPYVYNEETERFLDSQAITIVADAKRGAIIWRPWWDIVEVWDGVPHDGTRKSKMLCSFRNYRTDAAMREAVDFYNSLPTR